jgi:hypothetical protein
MIIKIDTENTFHNIRYCFCDTNSCEARNEVTTDLKKWGEGGLEE